MCTTVSDELMNVTVGVIWLAEKGNLSKEDSFFDVGLDIWVGEEVNFPLIEPKIPDRVA
jgi:hypothetical protein